MPNYALREVVLDELLAPAVRKMSLTKLRRPRSGIPCSICSTTSEKVEFCVHLFGENFIEKQREEEESSRCEPHHLLTRFALDGEKRRKKAAPRFPPAYHSCA